MAYGGTDWKVFAEAVRDRLGITPRLNIQTFLIMPMQGLSLVCFPIELHQADNPENVIAVDIELVFVRCDISL